MTDFRTIANGLFPSGQRVENMSKEGQDEVRAAVDALLRVWDRTNARLSLALQQIDRAADAINKKRSGSLPGCMMPDGAEPCESYTSLRTALNGIGDQLDAMLGRYELPRTMPIGWSEADCERIADYVEPMRQEIQRLREIAYEAVK